MVDSGAFALTPTLSPGEREKRSQRLVDAVVCVGFELFEPSESGVSGANLGTSSEHSNALPLPRGEGRGEGERTGKFADA